jgi:hypothetical protein
MSAFLQAFAHFDDHMEAQEPGYKARRAQERAERKRQWAEYRIAVIAKYGSEDAVKAPTPIEQAIEAAVQPLRRSVRDGTRALESLDGWHSSTREAPDSVRRTVEQAWPMPSTILEAKAEDDRWLERDDELAAVWGAERGMNSFLSLACQLRQRLVQNLLGNELRAQSVADALARHRYKLALGMHAEEIEQALLADLEHLAEAEAAIPALQG